MSLLTPSPTRRFRAEWLVLAAIMLLIGTVLSLALYRARTSIEVQESDRLQGHARVVDDTLIRQLEGVNNALKGVRDEIEHQGPGRAAVASSNRLKLLGSAMPGVRALAILDAQGTIRATSREELLGVNSSQRAFFDAPRKSPNRDVLYVSAPFRSPLGPLVVAVSRALTGAQGEFAGVAVATLDPEYFQVVLRAVLYAPDMRVALAHGDGDVFVNMPVNERTLGMNLAKPGSMFTRHVQSGQAATLATGKVLATGDERMMAIRTIDRADLQMNKVLVVAVSREVPAIYLPWRHQALRFGLFFAVVALASSWGLYFSQRRRLAFDRLAAAAAKAQLESSERLELALRGADLGLWDLQVPNSQLVVNARERQLLGVAEGEDLPGSDWRRLVHPDDLPALDAAIQPHLRGETAAYECEHRMQRKDGQWIWVFSRAMVVERGATGAPLRIVGTHLDITERKRTQAELARTADMLQLSEERLSLALEGSGLALFDWDIAGDRIYHSAKASAMRDEPAIETTSSAAELRAFVHPDDLDALSASLKAAVTGAEPIYHAEFRLRRRSGAWLWVRARGRVVERDSGGRALRLAGTYADFNDAKAAEEKLRRLAEFDTLTDLPNRAQFRLRLQQAMARSPRNEAMALLYLDVDHFKTINDTLGHEAGDQLLKVFATRMLDCVRLSDTVARLGGDEFTIILEGLHAPSDAKALASKLVETLGQPMALGGRLHHTTVSIGIAMHLAGETDDGALLARADAALYEAKRRGRNGYFCDDVPSGVACSSGADTEA